jgi:hypothetical protein
MKHGWLRLAVGMALAAIPGLLVSPPLLAGPPERIMPFESFSDPTFMARCADGFDVYSGGTLYGFGKWFPTKGGGRLDLHFKTDDVFVNASTLKTVVGHASWRGSIDYATDEPVWEYSGLFWHVVIPGVGNVLHDAGRMLVNDETGEIEFIKGTYQWNVGDFEELCEALK